MKRSRNLKLLLHPVFCRVTAAASPLLHLPAIPSYLDGRIAEAKESKECVE